MCKCIKCGLKLILNIWVLAVNIVFFACGLYFLLTGSYFSTDNVQVILPDVVNLGSYSAGASPLAAATMIIMTITGIGLMTAAVFGLLALCWCCKGDCACRGLSAILLAISAAIMTILLVVTIIGLFMAQASMLDSMNAQLTFVYNSADDDTGVTDSWDAVQTRFECCGVYNYTDWQHSKSTDGHVPWSCCVMDDNFAAADESNILNKTACMNFFNTTDPTYESFANTQGCYTQVEDYLKVFGFVTLGVVVGVFILQIISSIFMCLCAPIRVVT